MRSLSIADDGTTVMEFTDAEAHALRNVLADLPGSPVADALQRHLAMAHGEISHQHRQPYADRACGCSARFTRHADGCTRANPTA